MRKTCRLTIEELADRWKLLLWEYGFEELLVTEHLKDGTQKSYVVNGLSMELEQDSAICSDYEGSLLCNNSRLVMFLQNSLKTITLLPYKNWYREELVFDNRTVYIELVS